MNEWNKFLKKNVALALGSAVIRENGDKAVAAPLKSSLFGKEVGYDGLEPFPPMHYVHVFFRGS